VVGWRGLDARRGEGTSVVPPPVPGSVSIQVAADILARGPGIRVIPMR